MNGVGANTIVTPKLPMVITICMILACAGAFFALLGAVLWFIGSRKLRKTEACIAYKTAEKNYKQSKK